MLQPSSKSHTGETLSTIFPPSRAEPLEIDRPACCVEKLASAKRKFKMGDGRVKGLKSCLLKFGIAFAPPSPGGSAKFQISFSGYK